MRSLLKTETFSHVPVLAPVLLNAAVMRVSAEGACPSPERVIFGVAEG